MSMGTQQQQRILECTNTPFRGIYLDKCQKLEVFNWSWSEFSRKSQKKLFMVLALSVANQTIAFPLNSDYDSNSFY